VQRGAGRPGRPPRARNGAGLAPTRERVLDTARRLFDERGYHTTSLTEIARESGIRAPSLLHHFAGKEELLDEVLRRFYLEGREKVVVALASGGTAGERMAGVVQAAREIWERHRGLVRLALSETFRPDGIGRDHVSEIAVPVVQLVANVLRESGDRPIPSEAPVQGALLLALSGELIRVALGDVGEDLWGPDRNRSAELEALLLKGLSDWTSQSGEIGGVFRPAGRSRGRARKKRERKG
jgi:AcrR family transcriptional regulator